MTEPNKKRVHVVCSREATDGIDKMLKELGFEPTYEVSPDSRGGTTPASALFEVSLRAWEESFILVVDLDYARAFEHGVVLGYMLARGRSLIGYKSSPWEESDFRVKEPMFIVNDSKAFRKCMEAIGDD